MMVDPRKPATTFTGGQVTNRRKSKAYLVGGGIGSLAAAAFMIRDGGMSGANISILEASPVMGGSLDGTGDPHLTDEEIMIAKSDVRVLDFKPG